MKLNYVGSSLLFLVIAVLLMSVFTLFESGLVGMSPGGERLLTFLALVMAPLAGAALAVISLLRREGRAWIAVFSAVVNALIALFHLFIVLFAG